MNILNTKVLQNEIVPAAKIAPKRELTGTPLHMPKTTYDKQLGGDVTGICNIVHCIRNPTWSKSLDPLVFSQIPTVSALKCCILKGMLSPNVWKNFHDDM